MLPFQNLIEIDREQSTPVFRQITDQMTALIREGSLKPGVFLPGTRQMAQLLGLNRKTVIKSYDEMLAENWIETILRKGYRVMLELPLIKPRSFHPRTSFALEPEQDGHFWLQRQPDDQAQREVRRSDILIDDGFPDPALSPYREITRLYGEDGSLLSRRLLGIRPQGGSLELKEAMSGFLNDSRALNISAREIMITRGGKMQLYLAASVLIKKGDKVAICKHTDKRSREIFIHAGAELIELESDREGIDSRHLNQVLQIHRIAVLYLNPHCHYPTTALLSATRRQAILELMKARDFWIIEDDMGYDFHHNNSPILPLASSPHNGKLIYIGSFERVIASARGVGFLVASPQIIQRAVSLQGLIDPFGDPYMEQLLTRMILGGTLERYILRARKMYAHRCSLLCDLLEGRLSRYVQFERPRAGLAVYLSFRQGFPMKRFIAEAAKLGVYFSTDEHDQLSFSTENALRLGFASLSVQEMEKTVEVMLRCAQLLESGHRKYRLETVPISAISA